ncbi:citrate transporter [Oscillospiraceae bacterium BX1]|uniref:Citrate transporter n=2 Tax=Yanshouia hominis TaxID=2763673 RepID=A0ABR7NHM2_9FIRM|nr:citrate transporter [Yanshouia hominis]
MQYGPQKNAKEGVVIMIFNLPPICGLFPLLLYIVLSFRKGMHPLVNVSICAVVGAILVKQPLGGLGAVIYESMGSFLALVGFIIMLGSGLGMVLRKTGVAAAIVNILMRKIGVKTQKRAILATMVSSICLVTLLGTLAGANAVIAPIVIPLVAAVGITPSTLAVIFQGAGQTGLFLSPFSPPMVTLMGITGLSYPRLLLCAGLPVSIVMWIGTYLIANKVQKETEGKEDFGPDVEMPSDNFEVDAITKRATAVFVATMAVMVVYGIITKGGASFVILVMIVAAILTGLAAKMPAGEIFDNIVEGCGKLMWLFFMFLMFNPFLNFVTASGAFDAMLKLMEPLIGSSGKVGFTLLTVLVGIFGINGAAVAQALMIDSLFNGFLPGIGISMELWGMIVLIGHQITSYAYPGVDMIGAMGLAHAKNIKPMLKLSYFAIIPGTVILSCIAALIL